MKARYFFGGGLMASLLLASWTPLEAQTRPGLAKSEPQDPATGLTVVGRSPFYSPFPHANVLSHGQALIPLFEGWAPKPGTGTILLSYSYFNMNYAETFDIPIGPDNFIEPSEFNGGQPTHFYPAPEDNGRRHRDQSVFVVRVPDDYRGDVVWTLRNGGQTYSVPGRATIEGYAIDDTVSLTNAPVAAGLKFDPSGPETKGRRGITLGPLTVAAGAPLPLRVFIDPEPAGTEEGARPPQGNAPMQAAQTIVTWYHHQGPGQVTFSERETVLEGADPGEVTTIASFEEPGEYVLRVTAIESLSAMVQHCCWTNAYVKVTVTP